MTPEQRSMTQCFSTEFELRTYMENDSLESGHSRVKICILLVVKVTRGSLNLFKSFLPPWSYSQNITGNIQEHKPQSDHKIFKSRIGSVCFSRLTALCLVNRNPAFILLCTPHDWWEARFILAHECHAPSSLNCLCVDLQEKQLKKYILKQSKQGRKRIGFAGSETVFFGKESWK